LPGRVNAAAVTKSPDISYPPAQYFRKIFTFKQLHATSKDEIKTIAISFSMLLFDDTRVCLLTL
ncbi:MAG: hypothetical protein PHZ02_16495, partial [Desulfocapsaceae bacterium]|nr:hypothetical protein [Desulfocapsaceae bacterium]